MKFLLILSMFLSTTMFAAGIGNYSNGVRIGLISKFGEKGMFVKSGEGQMLMGSDSTPYIITEKDSDGNTTTKTINPWYFSSVNEEITKRLESNVGQFVVLHYSQSHIKGFSVDTSYEITDITEITEPLSESCETEDYIKGSKSTGSRVGRFVKLSQKGTFVDSNEVMFQQGFSGNQFKNMSVTTPEMYECAYNFLTAGQKVKITYSQSLLNTSVFGRDTRYDIIKIEPIRTGLN